MVKRLVLAALKRRGLMLVKTVELDYPLLTHLRELLARLEINTVLDVGAHYGEYASRLRRIDYEGRIVSFEPLQQNFQVLERAAASDPEWSVKRIALGAKTGTRTMRVAERSDGSSFFESSGLAMQLEPRFATKGTEQVDVRSLADLWPSFVGAADRVLLKTDAQGADLDILRAAPLERVAAVQCELTLLPMYDQQEPTFHGGILWLTEQGFALTNVSSVFTDGLRMLEADCVFVRRS
jgi:FkbM family methyltransferase